jgi:hypothetical protein
LGNGGPALRLEIERRHGTRDGQIKPDALSRSELQNGQPLPSVSSYTKPKVNADGSIDIFFGPNEPKDAGNWIKTVSGKGWLLDDAAEFARTYVGPRLPHRRDRLCAVSKRYPTTPACVLLRERFARGQ